MLYVVATPIGNLNDITFRAVDILKSVDFIATEDTRTTGKLLKHYSISTKMISYHEHNEILSADNICNLLEAGKEVALVSDAGTPCISDPGYRVVHQAKIIGFQVISIPGASSVTSALSVSGLPTDHFYFEGFLPRKKGRKTRFEFLCNLEATIVIFESPMRLLKTLSHINDFMGERVVSVCRELTKIYEETYMGTVSDSIEYFSKSKIRGEIVILIAKEGYKI
ncbi:MAG: 16S rRNA (cytidine(1402)-2'-O)-methyltransferase [Candidatus Marinimicrobia bacterium]|nr:16S rRNA (cytidine(1402)-2'-O)-methyltransferase [Candidatus Neomarinimicrobiota bacterium]MBL7022762.1 16S rRNA (cytidine(1402)-2'-O)-methyltransferase [Candidatus Neomarinimicrobiota bacterium]MBL7109717.1 16S rRNA (cytidine(1402)-2'-O)-methyltransferase [Candidatus Neomarinimicrobiota bacterium]